MTKRKLKNFTVGCDDAGVFRIVLDVPGRPVNVLDHCVMQELDGIIAELEQRNDVQLVVFKSGKESGFLAGADVESIAEIETADQALPVLTLGQRLFDRIERLPMTTVALIHGPCLGGGLELALACDYRVARDNSSTKIGLPEIKLGLIPGWGGTQRLPRLVGLRHGLSLILTGKHLSAREACNIGLIDRAIDPDHWRDEVVRVIDDLVSGRRLSSVTAKLKSLLQRCDSIGLLKDWILSITQTKLAKKSEHYPALAAAIRSIADGLDKHADGFDTERQEFARLVTTPTCRQLLRLFFSREQARNTKTWTANSAWGIHREPIRKLGVIGAGAMGAGIAQVAATRGYEVCVKEADEQAARRGRQRIHQLISQYARHKGICVAAEETLRRQVTVAEHFDTFADVDCVIEAVVERMDVKKSVLAAAEHSIKNTTILATNTSALSVSEMAQSISRPSHFAGLHFFNPVHRMELVEVVRGEHTSDETIARLVNLVRALGKTPIVTSDSPGFLVNRILFPYLGESILMIREGHDVATLDREIRKFGMPMGPIELLDRVGLDVALHVAQSLRPIMKDVDEVINVLAPLVERGETGFKTGRGFYDYGGKRKRPRQSRELVGYLVAPPLQVDFKFDGLSDIQRRLIYPMLAEAVRCEEESVVSHRWAIDLAMVLGTGFAPHRGGPISLTEQIGEDTVVTNLERLRSQFGDRFKTPQMFSTGAKR